MALEMVVMQIVEKFTQELNPTFGNNFVEADIAKTRHQSGDLQGEHGVDQVRGLANYENH